MGLHNDYLLAISVIFALVFAIMLYSLIRYRKPGGETPRFSGPTGRVQWLWALVPMAILGAVNLALIDRSADQPNGFPKKIELAAVHK
jgi:cytochrome c oxidase subunit 2